MRPNCPAPPRTPSLDRLLHSLTRSDDGLIAAWARALRDEGEGQADRRPATQQMGLER
jgi:hypothetical protein